MIPAVARLLGRPVKWIEDRWENLAASVHSKEMVCTIEIAVDADGTFMAFRGHFITDSGAYSSVPFTPLVDSQCAGGMLPELLHGRRTSRTRSTTRSRTSARSARSAASAGCPGQLAREVAIDDVARELGHRPGRAAAAQHHGPASRRRTRSARPTTAAATPRRSSWRATRSATRSSASVRRDAARAGPLHRRRLQPVRRADRLGDRRAPRPNGLPSGFFDTASVTIEPDGSVTVTTGLHSHGQGHETTFAQIAADELGVPIETSAIVYGDTDSAVVRAWGPTRAAARSSAAAAIREAAGEVRDRLLQLAGAMLEASPEDIELVDGRAQVKGAPEPVGADRRDRGLRLLRWRVATEAIQRDGLTATAALRARRRPTRTGAPAAVVEVDVETGVVTVEQLVAVEDCGVDAQPDDRRRARSRARSRRASGSRCSRTSSTTTTASSSPGSLLHYLFPTTARCPMLDLEHHRDAVAGHAPAVSRASARRARSRRRPRSSTRSPTRSARSA